jgi:hypothetical protein
VSKKIVAIGVEKFPDDESFETIKCCSWDDRISLGDFDIIVLSPTTKFKVYEKYMGKDCLSDNDSGKLISNINYWKSQIDFAIEDRKTIFILSEAPYECLYATGEKTYSETGRNKIATRKVKPFDSYELLPLPASSHQAGKGANIEFKSGNSVLRSLWEENQEYFHYAVTYKKSLLGKNAMFFQKKGSEALGGIVTSSKDSSIVILPALDLSHNKFFTEVTNEETNWISTSWSEIAKQFTRKFANSIVEIDTALKQQDSLTPPPPWVRDPDFELAESTKIKADLAKYGMAKTIIIRIREAIGERGSPCAQRIKFYGRSFSRFRI